jgi:hypothetical protein
MTPLSMPISPYERQLLAQSSAPAHPPVMANPVMAHNDPFPPPAGMMPMHGRMENIPASAPQNMQQNMQRPATAPPQYTTPPQYYVQGQGYVQPGAVPPNSLHGQYGQYAPYAAAVPQNYAAPPNTPIPAGVSTLPTQNNGYYAPTHGAPMQRPPSDFNNTNPQYRRVY